MSRYQCQHPGCERSPETGDLIYRTSAKGQPFTGACAEHYSGEFATLVNALAARQAKR